MGSATRGSFVATTVDALVWSSGKQFSATNPGGANSLLTIVGDPSGFISSLRPPKPIVSSGSTLSVYEGQSLLLLGGDVTLDGSFLYVDYFEGGRIDLGGVAGAGTVGLDVDGNNLRLSFPDDVTRADVSITNETGIYVVAEDGGSVAINARNLDISGKSSVDAGIDEDLGSVGSQAGDIEINTTGAVTIAGSDIINTVQRRAVGNSGNINITAESLSVTDGAQLVASTYGQGYAGSVNINARDMVTLEGSAAFSTVESRAVGKGGDINITTGSLSMTDGAKLVANTFGRGNAGSVNINAGDRVSFDGEGSDGSNTAAFSTVGSEGIGNGVGINITARSLSVTNGAILIASTKGRGQGNAGSVNINARDSVSFDGFGSDGFPSAALSAVEFEGIGKGGDINITAGSLSVTNGAYLSASTLGQEGDAGSVNINARDTVSFNGVGSNGLPSAAFSTVESGAVGNGTGINITAGSLSVMNGALLSASTRGQGNGGNITLNANTLEAVNGGQVLTTSRSSGKAGNIIINATDSVTLAGSDPSYFARLAQPGEKVGVFEVFGKKVPTDEQVFADAGPASGLFASTFENSTGQGGDLTVTTGQLVIRDDAQVNVSSEGTGNAGNLEVTSRNLQLDNRAVLRATTSSGEGGNIKLLEQDLILMRRNSEISTQARGTGNGGNIDIINADLIVAVPGENSDIVANAFQGNGGNINITTSGIFGIEFRERRTLQSDITASSDFGLDGTVDINTPDVDPSRGLINLPVEPVDTEVAQGCTAGGTVAKSEFIITGRGGLPPNPGSALSTDAVQVNLITLNPEVARSSTTAVSTSPTSSKPARIVEAQGWAQGANGEVILTANAPTVTPHSSWHTPANCHVPKTSS